jgi:hypothetical protein
VIYARISTAATAFALALSLQATPALADDGADHPSEQFHAGKQNIISCGAFLQCDIQIQPGEQINETGESLLKIFDAKIFHDPSGGQETRHLAIKPKQPGQRETVFFTTNRRMYHLLIVSTTSKRPTFFMFSYGDEERAKERHARHVREIAETYRIQRYRHSRKVESSTVSILDQACNSMPQAQWRMDRTPGEFVPRKICQSRDHTYVAMPVGPMQSNDLPVPQLNTSDGDRPVNSHFDERERVFVIDGTAQNYVLKGTRGRKEVRLRIQRDDQPAQPQQQSKQGRRRHHHG